MMNIYHEHQYHAGYYYNWITPLQEWGLKWRPLKNVYSPPLLDQSLQWVHIAPLQGINVIPLLGDGDMHLEKFAKEIDATYIYYRADMNKMEIWAHDITSAATKLSIYFQQVKERRCNENKNKNNKTKLIPSL